VLAAAQIEQKREFGVALALGHYELLTSFGFVVL
jgi:hypothetical protein